MKIRVRFLGPVKDAAGTSEDRVDISSSAIGDVINALAVKYGDTFRQEVFQPDGNIKQSVKVFLNGKWVTPLQNVAVNEGDTLDIFPPFYGG